MKYVIFILVMVSLFACKESNPIEEALKEAGKNRSELEKVIKHYSKPEDELKLNAAYFLIKNLPAQYYYEGKAVSKCRAVFNKMEYLISSKSEIDYSSVWDSLQKVINNSKSGELIRIRDITVIKGDYLIKNIDEAFIAWNYPWAKNLSFDEFCRYILPYKMKNEKPGEWRAFFMNRYRWLPYSLKKASSSLNACSKINDDLKRWFYYTKLDVPFDLSPEDLLKIKSGKCPQQVQLAAYAMRAMGIPVAIDGVPYWANRGSRHDWNALHYKGRTIPFLGAEVNPGEYKIEFKYPGGINSKRAKIFRVTYDVQSQNTLGLEKKEIVPFIFENVLYKDVTAEYVPVSNVSIQLNTELIDDEFKYGYLCVFNNKKWKPVDWAVIKDRVMQFKQVGAYNIMYLPTVFEESQFVPAADPFILCEDGSKRIVVPDLSHRISFSIDRKYPSGDDNYIVIGQTYELVYWNKGWNILDRITASEKNLTFSNVPHGALLWLRNLSEGFQERIFTLENGKIIWW